MVYMLKYLWEYSVLQGENNEYKIRIKNAGFGGYFDCFHPVLRVCG